MEFIWTDPFFAGDVIFIIALYSFLSGLTNSNPAFTSAPVFLSISVSSLGYFLHTKNHIDPNYKIPSNVYAFYILQNLLEYLT